VSIRTETQVHEVEDQRRPSDRLEQLLVRRRALVEVLRQDGHAQQLRCGERSFPHENLLEAREVAAGIAVRSDALVDLCNEDIRPRQGERTELTEHEPRCLTAAHGQQGPAARGHGFPARGTDVVRCEPRSGGGVHGEFKSHAAPPSGRGAVHRPQVKPSIEAAG